MPKKSKKPSKKTPSSEKIAHYTAVLVEGLRSDFRIVSEKVDCIEANIKKEMNERFDQQNQRFNIIEAVLKMHSQMLQANDKRWEANDKRWEENQVTLREILKSIKDVSEKVNRHDDEIQEIKRKIA